MKFWVTMTDKLMSGWGKAQRKINKLVLECNSLEEAIKVAGYAKQRKEMKYINITMKKPWYDQRYYYTSFHTKDDYSTWYRGEELGE